MVGHIHRMKNTLSSSLLLIICSILMCLQPAAKDTQTNDNVLSVIVRKNDNLEKIFQRNHIPLSDLNNYMKKEINAKKLHKIFPGQLLEIYFDKGKKIAKMWVGKKNTAEKQEPEPVLKQKSYKPPKYKKIQFFIKNSLFVDGQKHGLSIADIQAITNLVKDDINISLNKLPSMSKFDVVISQDENPHVISLDIEYHGKKWSATEFKLEGQRAQYYHSDGSSLSSTFLRYPLKKFYVSSEFSPSRIHPILRVRRPHFGVDFAAPYGSPVWATAAGKIEFVGKKGGFGNVVVVRHDKHYTSTYAHLSRFSKTTKEGAYVAEKQIIGFVGKSGIATGPHLHYELRRNGIAINPLGKKLPEKSVLAGRALEYFLKFRELLTVGN